MISLDIIECLTIIVKVGFTITVDYNNNIKKREPILNTPSAKLYINLLATGAFSFKAFLRMDGFMGFLVVRKNYFQNIFILPLTNVMRMIILFLSGSTSTLGYNTVI